MIYLGIALVGPGLQAPMGTVMYKEYTHSLLLLRSTTAFFSNEITRKMNCQFEGEGDISGNFSKEKRTIIRY